MTDTQQQPAAEAPKAQAGGTKARLREYETLFLLKSEVADEAIDRLKERLREVVLREQGKVLKFTHWGKKKTAFVVARQTRASYVHCSFLGTPGIVAEVERNLSLSEDVTKFLSTRIADDVDPDTRAVEPDVKLAGDADERPRSEREGGAGSEGPSFGGPPPHEREAAHDEIPELE